MSSRIKAFEYFYGIGKGQDFSQALPRFKVAYSEGDSDSGAIVGIMIGAGLGGPKDEKRSQRIIRDAYTRGSGLAAYLLAGTGDLTEPSQREMREQFLEFAVSKNVPEARFELASSLMRRKPSKEVSIKAKDMFSKGCEMGDIRACHSLGVMLYTDLHIPQNHSESLAILLMCADFGSESCETAAGHVITKISRSDREVAIQKAAFYIEKGYRSK